MTKRIITLELSIEQLSFLKNLTNDIASELKSISETRSGDKIIAQKAKLAEQIDKQININTPPITTL